MKFTHALAALALAGTAILSTASYAQEQVNLTWQMWGDEKDTPLFQQLADLVTAEYPNIKVTPQFSGWTDYWTRLPVLASSGQIPSMARDLVVLADLVFLQFRCYGTEFSRHCRCRRGVGTRSRESLLHRTHCGDQLGELVVGLGRRGERIIPVRVPDIYR